MNWITLIIAGLFEVEFAYCLGEATLATGSKVYFWYGGFIVTLAVSMTLLTKAVQTLPVGTAYAIWTGIGGDYLPKKMAQPLKLMDVTKLDLDVIWLRYKTR